MSAVESASRLGYILEIKTAVTGMPLPAPFHRSVLPLFLVLFLPPGPAFPQENSHSSHLLFLPGGTTFPSLIAQSEEARTGLLRELSSSRLGLEIGTAFDLLQWNLSGDGKKRLRVGADFFAHALTRSAEGLRLQVDAVDGEFGGHITIRLEAERGFSVLRLRLMHLSGHFADGHVDYATRWWRDGRGPIPFTRDYGELLGAYGFCLPSFTLMPYAAINYGTLVRPVTIRRFAYLAGAEAHSSDNLIRVFGQPFVPFGALNLSLYGIPKYAGTTTLVAGGKFGRWEGVGVKIYARYIAGPDIYTQYYDVRRSSVGLGFSLDVW